MWCVLFVVVPWLLGLHAPIHCQAQRWLRPRSKLAHLCRRPWQLPSAGVVHLRVVMHCVLRWCERLRPNLRHMRQGWRLANTALHALDPWADLRPRCLPTCHLEQRPADSPWQTATAKRRCSNREYSRHQHIHNRMKYLQI